MRPIFSSPNDVQTQVIQSMLRQHGIETSLIEKKDLRQSYNLPKVIWQELWLRDEMDAQSAAIAITQFQFNTFRKDLRIAEEPSKSNSINQTTPQDQPKIGIESDEYSIEDEDDHDTDCLPVNNRRVFNYLAEVLGIANNDKTEGTDIKKIAQPWDGKSLMKTVNSLKQICR